MELGVVVMKKQFEIGIPSDREPHHQMEFNGILRTPFWMKGLIPLLEIQSTYSKPHLTFYPPILIWTSLIVIVSIHINSLIWKYRDGCWFGFCQHSYLHGFQGQLKNSQAYQGTLMEFNQVKLIFQDSPLYELYTSSSRIAVLGSQW